MYKLVSDIYETEGGHFAIEWEWSDGGRHIQLFKTDAERREALDKNEKYNEAHKEEIEAEELRQEEWLAEQEALYNKEWNENE